MPHHDRTLDDRMLDSMPAGLLPVEIWHNPACGTSRNALALIRHVGIEPRVVDYVNAPPSKQVSPNLIIQGVMA